MLWRSCKAHSLGSCGGADANMCSTSSLQPAKLVAELRALATSEHLLLLKVRPSLSR